MVCLNNNTKIIFFKKNGGIQCSKLPLLAQYPIAKLLLRYYDK